VDDAVAVDEQEPPRRALVRAGLGGCVHAAIIAPAAPPFDRGEWTKGWWLRGRPNLAVNVKVAYNPLAVHIRKDRVQPVDPLAGLKAGLPGNRTE
jgi:hypothetical protein